MKIGIMSDSHDHLQNIRKAVERFMQEQVDLVIHLGDFVNPNSVRALKGIELTAIFGNNDGDKFRLMKAFEDAGASIMGEFYEFEADSLKIACYHGTEPGIKNALIGCGRYDAVLYGHTHEPERSQAGRTLVLNPGTVHGFGSDATVMVLDTGSRKARLVVL